LEKKVGPTLEKNPGSAPDSYITTPSPYVLYLRLLKSFLTWSLGLKWRNDRTRHYLNFANGW